MESYNYWLSIVARELNEPETTVRSGLDVSVTLLNIVFLALIDLGLGC
jgi:hypothetical protein